MPVRRILRPALLLLALLFAAALFSGCKKERTWQVGSPAPEISLLDLEDATVTLSQYRGQPVVLRFWATGCSACVAQMPVLEQQSKSYRERGLVVLAVNMGNPKPLVAAFAQGLKLSYPMFLDPAQIAVKKYGVKMAPTTFFIDRKGVAHKAVLGEVTREDFEATVNGLM